MELYVINADGTGLRQLTSDAGDNIFGRWSRDGSVIVYSRLFIVTNQGAYHHLATVNADGTNPHFLTHALFDDLEPALLPDGRRLAFGSGRENLRSALWVANADGSKPKRITEPSLSAGTPDISPDGLKLVFHEHENTEYFPAVHAHGSHAGRYCRVCGTVTGIVIIRRQIPIAQKMDTSQTGYPPLHKVLSPSESRDHEEAAHVCCVYSGTRQTLEVVLADRLGSTECSATSNRCENRSRRAFVIPTAYRRSRVVKTREDS